MSHQITIVSLGKRINEEHRACESAFGESLEHARRAGELLIEAKAKVDHGDWTPWVSDSCEFSNRTARLYMRIARRWDELESKRQHVASLSLRQAAKMLTAKKEELDWFAESEEAVREQYTIGGEIKILEYDLELAETEQDAKEVFRIAKRAGELAQRAKVAQIRAERRAGQVMNLERVVKAQEILDRLEGDLLEFSPTGARYLRQSTKEEWLEIGEVLAVAGRVPEILAPFIADESE